MTDENARLNIRRGWQHGEVGGPPWASQVKIFAEAIVLREAIERTTRDERDQKLYEALNEYIGDEIKDDDSPRFSPEDIAAARKLINEIDDYERDGY